MKSKKVSYETVLEIVRIRGEEGRDSRGRYPGHPEKSVAAICERFGISRSTAKRILNGSYLLPPGVTNAAS